MTYCATHGGLHEYTCSDTQGVPPHTHMHWLLQWAIACAIAHGCANSICAVTAASCQTIQAVYWQLSCTSLLLSCCYAVNGAVFQWDESESAYRETAFKSQFHRLNTCSNNSTAWVGLKWFNYREQPKTNLGRVHFNGKVILIGTLIKEYNSSSPKYWYYDGS